MCVCEIVCENVLFVSGCLDAKDMCAQLISLGLSLEGTYYQFSTNLEGTW